MTVLAELPAVVMHMAAQFTHSDPCKEGITCIHLQQKSDGIRVASTNGHFAFRCLVPYGPFCSFFDSQTLADWSLLVPASSFKKKVNYAQKVSIGNGEARFIGGKKMEIDMLETRPCKESEWPFPSQFDSLWPDPASMENAPAAPVTINADYMRIICDTIAKFSDNGLVKMHLANSATSAMLLTANLDDLALQFLLLPVMVRA
jgi:hypothetical protein